MLEDQMQESETIEATESETTAQALNSADRCDSCGAQAYVRATLEFGELLFCLHHAVENKEALAPVTITWHDESDKLLAR
jgi:hypothetical protein